MTLRIHAICLALNEEPFIKNTLKVLYPFCSGISVLSQYDRDWYGSSVIPDRTIQHALDFPDPDGKVHVIIRRWKDEAAARNHEMLALDAKCARSVQTHGVPKEQVVDFHRAPDYFLIVDADEIYDADTLGNVIEYLQRKKPRGMRVLGYLYVKTWNHRVLPETITFRHFGFLRPGILFEMLRTVSWNESRLAKLLGILRLPDVSSRIYGFINCPDQVGVFHHGWLLGDAARHKHKIARSGHRSELPTDWLTKSLATPTVFIPTMELPRNIREGDWPPSFFDEGQNPTKA